MTYFILIGDYCLNILYTGPRSCLWLTKICCTQQHSPRSFHTNDLQFEYFGFDIGSPVKSISVGKRFLVGLAHRKFIQIFRDEPVRDVASDVLIPENIITGNLFSLGNEITP